jgi:hypothetical protein
MAGIREAENGVFGMIGGPILCTTPFGRESWDVSDWRWKIVMLFIVLAIRVGLVLCICYSLFRIRVPFVVN